MNVFVDEAHHIYDDIDEQTQLRKAIQNIHKNNPSGLISCICVSGTPYLKSPQSFTLDNKKIDIDNIQDTIYYYPLKHGIGNFLKKPKIETISERKIISEGLDKFFSNYNKKYKDGTLSKVAIYCIDSTHLVEVKKEAEKWCSKNGYNKDATILPYYSESVKNAESLPKENKYHFDNLDNPSSRFRIILLIGIGTEGWDCRSLT